MFPTTVAFRLSSRTFIRKFIFRIRVQHRLSFDDPFKQHNRSNNICCFRQLSRLWRIFDLFNTIAADTCSKKRCSIRLAEEPKFTSTAKQALKLVYLPQSVRDRNRIHQKNLEKNTPFPPPRAPQIIFDHRVETTHNIIYTYTVES